MFLTRPSFYVLSSTSEFILTLIFSGVCSVCAGNKTLFLWYLSLLCICCNIGNWRYLYKLLQVVLFIFLKIYLISILLKLCTYLYILYVIFLVVHLQFSHKQKYHQHSYIMSVAFSLIYAILISLSSLL